MSDGLSEGARSEREHAARQQKIDDFFGAVWWEIHHPKGPHAGKKLREAFDLFDAYRYSDSLLHGRLMKERGKRWEAFASSLGAACDRPADARVKKAWAEILTLALRFASPAVTEKLKASSPFKAYHIALYVPNGTGFYGRNDPTLLGDFAGALDALAAPERPDTFAAVVDEPGRAVVGVRQGVAGAEREILEEERAKLRFLAVEKR